MSVQNKEKKDTKPKETLNIPKGIAKEITKVATETAVKAFMNAKNEELMKTKDNRFHNTKLLVQRYRSFKDYCDNAIYETAQLCGESNEEILALMGVDCGTAYQVGSIRNGVIVTKIIMEHVDTMLNCYHSRCMSSKKPEKKRRWRVLNYMYLGSTLKSAQEVADIEHISLSSVYLDIDAACEELSSLIFGLDLSEFI